jgi:hypothetical protein
MQNLLLDPPTLYGQRENIRRMLGIKDAAILDLFLMSPRVSRLIDQRLVEKLGELPEMSKEDKHLVDTLLLAPDDQFQDIARIVAVLSQSKVIKRTISGAMLSAVASFAGSRDIIQYARINELPVFIGLRPSMELDEKLLQDYAETAQEFMFGLLPRNYQLRLMLQRPQGQLRGGISVSDINANSALKALIVAAMRYLATHKIEHTDAERANEND